MGPRVNLYGKVKSLRLGAAAKASANSASKSCGLDPKISDLSMGRVKRL